MPPLAPSNSENGGEQLKCEENRKTSDALLPAAGQGAPATALGKLTSVFRQQSMPEERVRRPAPCAPPEAGRPAEDHRGFQPPVLEQPHERELVVQARQTRIDCGNFITEEMMQR